VLSFWAFYSPYFIAIFSRMASMTLSENSWDIVAVFFTAIFYLPALGDVFDSQKDRLRDAFFLNDPAGIEQHDFAIDG